MAHGPCAPPRLYLVVALRRVYGGGWPWAAARGVMLFAQHLLATLLAVSMIAVVVLFMSV